MPLLAKRLRRGGCAAAGVVLQGLSNLRQPPRLPVSPLAVGQPPLLKRFARRGKSNTETTRMPKVLIILGSKSDMEFAKTCAKQLQTLGIESSIEVSSAHRHPERTGKLTSEAEANGFEVIVAMAGLSAALPGVAAAHSNLPVIGVPIPAALDGLDSLLSVVQMPPGIPVAAVAIGKPGATNAAILAARILALKYPGVKKSLDKHRKSL